MIRLLHRPQAAKRTYIGSAIASAAIHALMIAVALLATLHRSTIESTLLANQPFYIAAPDRMVARDGSAPTVQRINREAEKPSTGEVRRAKDEIHRDTVALAGNPQTAERDRTATNAVAPSAGNDSVYSVLDVDSAVVRLSTSATPVYPPVLAAARIQGYVTMRYVVDTTGVADTSTVLVLDSTNPAFLQSVRDALPHMRFSPAVAGSRKVRQFVEQQFVFRLVNEGSIFTVTQPPLNARRSPPRSRSHRYA